MTDAGKGPMPLLGDHTHTDIVRSLKQRVPKILGLGTPAQPKAIVLVTAHWSTSKPHISSAEGHSLLYDYGGFPPEAYDLHYPAQGHPEVAAEVKTVFDDAGIESVVDKKRGWDHGVFVPMLLIDPKGTVPIVQVSVLGSEDPAAHLRMGAALHRLREQNVAIVGSGFASFHNLRLMLPLMRSGGGSPLDPSAQALKRKSEAFNRALTAAVTHEEKSEREAGLTRWREMDSAYDMHPRGGGEHFMPLIVCAGAAGDGEKAQVYKDGYLGVDILTYYWGVDQPLD